MKKISFISAKLFLIFSVMIIGLVISCATKVTDFSKPRILLVCGGDGDKPAVAVIPPGNEYQGAIVLSCGGKQASYELPAALRRNGIDKIDILCITNASANIKNGENLVNRMSIAQLVCWINQNSRGDCEKLAEKVNAQGGAVSMEYFQGENKNLMAETVTGAGKVSCHQVDGRQKISYEGADWAITVEFMRSGMTRIIWRNGDRQNIREIPLSNRKMTILL